MSVFRVVATLIAVSSLSGPALAVLMSPQGTADIPSAASSPMAQRYEAGMLALTRKDLAAAEAAFKDAAKLDPASPLPLIGLADVAAQRKQPDQAWSLLQQAARVAPQSGLPAHAMGRFHYNEKAYAKAEQAFKKALEFSPDNALFNLDLADLYANSLKKPDASLVYYRKVIRQQPKHAGAHHGLGMVLWKMGQTAEAEASLRRAASLAPGNPMSLQALGKLLEGQGKTDAALTAYQDALKAQPDFVPALMGQGDVYLGQGNFKQALTAYQQAVKLMPKYDLAHLKAGMALQGLNRVKEAEGAYKQAIALSPNLALGYNNLAWLAADTRTNLVQAEQWAKKAVELAPDIADFHDTLGWVYRAQSRFAEAENALKKAVQIQPSAPFHYHLGVVYQDQGKTREAAAAFEKSLAIQKDFAPSQRALGTLKNGKK